MTMKFDTSMSLLIEGAQPWEYHHDLLEIDDRHIPTDREDMWRSWNLGATKPSGDWVRVQPWMEKFNMLPGRKLQGSLFVIDSITVTCTAGSWWLVASQQQDRPWPGAGQHLLRDGARRRHHRLLRRRAGRLPIRRAWRRRQCRHNPPRHGLTNRQQNQGHAQSRDAALEACK